jgi:hypothetical protein
MGEASLCVVTFSPTRIRANRSPSSSNPVRHITTPGTARRQSVRTYRAHERIAGMMVRGRRLSQSDLEKELDALRSP